MSMDALKVKLENGKEKFGGVTVQFDKINITTITIEETMATKVVNKIKVWQEHCKREIEGHPHN